jgi:TetR/AcrR family transcriptional regulator
MDNKEDSKKLIIESGAKIFAEKGKDGARMKHIAKEAGVSSALLHYHYHSKDELYQEVLNYYLINKLRNLFIENFLSFKNSEYLKTLTPKELIANIIYFYNDFLNKNKYFTKLLVQELSMDSSNLKKIIEDTTNSKRKHERDNWIRNYFKNAYKEGLIRKVDPFHFWLTCNILIMSQFMYEPFIDVLLETKNIEKEQFKKERLEKLIEQIWYMIKK